jgi:hypothetical protein
MAMGLHRFAILIALTCPLAAQTGGKLDPTVQKVVSEVSKEKIGEYMQHLGAFGTRGNFTDPAASDRGIGAARRWIFDQLKSFSPRLQVSFDSYPLKGQATGRIFRDVDMVNVVAVLPGTTNPEKRIIVSGHYDSINMLRKPGKDGQPGELDNEKSVDAPAPGVSDDASGTAVVMELARVMSQHQFEKTIVFVAFAGEELGLIGSTLYAEKAKKSGDRIEAVLNNDIVGNDVDGEGRAESGLVHVFSDDPIDSPSRELARYIRDMGVRYVPGFRADVVFRNDRFSRGGDHTPFSYNGYAAVRFTTPAENLGAQHTANDTFDKSSPAYTANVARVNGAALASLALAPSAPVVTKTATTGLAKGRITPNLERGKSQYDAVLKWTDDKPEPDLEGYAIVMRSTLAPFWDREIFVGKVNQYTMTGLSIDDIVLGVKAIDKDGNESLVAPYVTPPFTMQKIEVKESPAKP